MGIMVIASFRPREGRAAQLLQLVREHVPTLRNLGLATELTPIVMRAANGTIIEVFEWASQEAIERAHKDEIAQAMWARFAEVCEYESLANLDECKGPFAHFSSVQF